jgi:hypothetical protein
MLYDSQGLFFKPHFPATDDPGSIIWLPTNATSSQHHGIPLHRMLYNSRQLFSKPCSINLGDYSSTTPKADITSVTILLLFSSWTTLALLFGSQRLPPAPNIAAIFCTERFTSVIDYSPNLAISTLVIIIPLLPTQII